MQLGPVMICDEERAELDLELRVLHSSGYSALAVPSDQLAMRAREAQPSLVVLGQGCGHRLPDIARQLRRDPMTRRIGLMATVSPSFPAHLHNRTGVNRVLPAPFSPWSFLVQVLTLLAVPPRRQVAFDLFLKRPDEQLVQAQAVNASEAGLLVRCEDGLSVGEECRAYLVLPGRVAPALTRVVRLALEIDFDHYALAFLEDRRRVHSILAPLFASGSADDGAPPLSIIDLLGDLRLAIRVDAGTYDRWIPLDVPPSLVGLLDGTRTAREVVHDSPLTEGEVGDWIARLIQADALEPPG